MIIKELTTCIKIDEIDKTAKPSELYFLSSILGFEMLSISEDWPGRIYTSKFIYDVLLKKKPTVSSKCLRILQPSVATKFRSKDKVIWVTVFEADTIKSSVIFYFDDTINTYLYVKAFNDITSCCKNEQFMLYVRRGISYVYLDATLSRSNPYISTEDTIEEIKTIARKHPNSKLVLIIPNFGYEQLLVELVQAFPQDVYPTKTQRYILTTLGYEQFICRNYENCRFIIFLPGINTENLELNVITIYITVGSAPVESNEYGAYLRQWSPLLCLADQQIFLEIIRPNHIVPIEESKFYEKQELPLSLRWLTKENPKKIIRQHSTESTMSWPENHSTRSCATTSEYASPKAKNDNTAIVSLPATEEFPAKTMSSEKANEKEKEEVQKSKETNKEECKKKQRKWVSRFNAFAFIDSSEEFE